MSKKSRKEIEDHKEALCYTKEELEVLKAKEEKELEDPLMKKTPLLLKILAVLLILSAALTIPILVVVIITLVSDLRNSFSSLDIVSFVITIVYFVSLLAFFVVGVIFGINLLRNRRRGARYMSETLLVIIIVSLLCNLMLEGLALTLLAYLIQLAVLIAIGTYIDPTLSEERRVQRKLRDMEVRDEAEEGTLGRDTSGKGYIRLDFFNIFWIFIIACVVGDVIETIFYALTVGGYQDRAGVLYGPFSPIYGFGGLLMTVALNRFYKKNAILIFFVSAFIGGGFEYLVSWFMEFSFGIVSWDYSGTFLSIDGRTNGMYMFFWGVLGCLWIKFVLPYVLKLVNLIPWNLRYTVTAICAALMIANGALTLAAYDSWYKRLAGQEATYALEMFCNEHYDDEFMENRFQTMSIDPDRSKRTDT